MRTTAAMLVLATATGCGRIVELLVERTVDQRPSRQEPATAEPGKLDPAISVPAHDGRVALPTTADEPPSPFGRPADAIAALDPDAVAFELYRASDHGASPYEGKEPPTGVQLHSTRRSGGEPFTSASIHRVDGETLAQTVARVRPWFAALELGAERRLLFEIVRPAAENADVEVAIVEHTPLAILGRDLEWIGTRPGRSGGVEIMWSASARARLPALTADLPDDTRAIVVAGRMLWMPGFGSALANDTLPWSLGFIRDATLAAAVRDAIAGKPEAIAALRDDTVIDGGRPDQVEPARLALLPPAPTRDADGRTHTKLEVFEGRVEGASFVLDDAWVLGRRDEHTVSWTRGDVEQQWTLELSYGCSGTCNQAKLDPQIEEQVVELTAKLSESTFAGYLEGRGVKESRVVVLDGREGNARVWGRARRFEPAPTFGVGPAVELHCWMHDEDDDHFVELELQAPWEAEADAIAGFKTMCAGLRTE